MLDSRGHLKIADFGIAKVVGIDGDFLSVTSQGESALTHASTSLGTPQYMAPEQVTYPNKVDHRADIYSLGVVFYEMLTGELPSATFVPPSQVSQIDTRIDAVVQRALEQERDERQQSADEVRTQVETIVQTRPPIPEPARRKRRLGPRWAASFIVLGLLLPLLAVLWVRFQMVESMQAHEERQKAFARVEVEVAEQVMEDLQSRLARETNPAEIATLTREYEQAQSDQAQAKRLMEERSPQTHSRLTNSFLMLLLISLPFLLIGTWKGWAHLKDLRAGHAERGVGSAMFAALLVPLILLFGAVFALIYIPASDAQGAWRSAGTSLAFIAAIGACFWLVRRTWRWTHRIEGASRAVGVMGCAIAIVILGMVSVPGALFLYWKSAAGELPPFSAPSSASVSGSTDSTYCSYTGDELHFILYHPGDFSAATGSSSNDIDHTWENDAELRLPNKRTVAIYRHSGRPDTLRLNGRAYSLGEGRVFLIDDDANIEQIRMKTPVVREQKELAEFIERLQFYRENQAAAPSAVPFDGHPEILCLQWQVEDSEPAVTWAPDGRLMERPEDLTFIENLQLPSHQITGPLDEGMDYQVLKFAVDHPAFDQLTSLSFEFYDTAGQLLSASSSGRHGPKPTAHRFAAGLRIPPPPLKTITMILKATGGAWERRPERFLASSFKKRIRFREFDNVTVQDTSERKVSFEVKVQTVEPTEPHQLKVVAILHTGEHQDHGSVGGHGTYERYFFEELALEDVQAFEFYTRPIHEFTYVNLPLMPYPTNNGIHE